MDSSAKLSRARRSPTAQDHCSPAATSPERDGAAPVRETPWCNGVFVAGRTACDVTTALPSVKRRRMGHPCAPAAQRNGCPLHRQPACRSSQMPQTRPPRIAAIFRSGNTSASICPLSCTFPTAHCLVPSPTAACMQADEQGDREKRERILVGRAPMVMRDRDRGLAQLCCTPLSWASALDALRPFWSIQLDLWMHSCALANSAARHLRSEWRQSRSGTWAGVNMDHRRDHSVASTAPSASAEAHTRTSRLEEQTLPLV